MTPRLLQNKEVDMRRFSVLILALALPACSTASLQKFQEYSTDFNTVIAVVNADIAKVAPVVMQDCAELQGVAALIRPFIPNNTKAANAFDKANAAIKAYCQVVPTDIPSTAVAVFLAAQAANADYSAIESK
jgi:hypothetical protein